jgi:drug/metabolite transporter (DMT)-like permease
MAAAKSMNWLTFALLTVVFWGLYGVFLHKGAMGMADPQFGRYKAFLVVGIAYFLVAVLGPLLLLKASGASLSMPSKGFWWSLIAGTVGALGALGVLLAFGKGGPPSAVMSIIFAGAPVVNAIVVISLQGEGFSSVRWQLILGVFFAALGGALVTIYKDPPPAPAVSESSEEKA